MIKKALIQKLQFIFILASFSSYSFSFSGSLTVNSIVIEGVKDINHDALIESLPVRVGSEFVNKKTSSDIISSLLQQGLFEENIKVLKRVSSGNKIDLKIVLSKKKTLTGYSFEGNHKVSTRELIKITKLKFIKDISLHGVEVLKEIISKKYIQSNMFDTAVEVKVVNDPEFYNGIKISFLIHEGLKSTITEVELIGCKKVLPSQVKEAMATKKSWLLSFIDKSGLLDKDRIEADKYHISRFYANKGFYDATVRDVIIKKDLPSSAVKVSFVIDEGPLYKVRFIDLPNYDDFPLDVLRKALLLKKGDVYSSTKLLASMDRLKSIFGSRGYVFCNVYPEVNRIKDGDNHYLDIRFQIEKGSVYKINEIKITGNDKTREYVIRNRALQVHDGDLANKVAMDASLSNVEALGYFDRNHLDWKISPIGEDLIDLELNLREVKTGSAHFGFSCKPARGSNDPSFLISGNVDKKNLGGLGWDGSFYCDFDGERFSKLGMDFFNPALFDQDYCFGVRASMNRLPYKEYNRFFEKNPLETAVSLGTSFGTYFFPRTHRIKSTIDFGMEFINFSEHELSSAYRHMKFAKVLTSQFQNGSYNWMALRFSKDCLNHPLYPSKGWRCDFDNKIAVPLFGLNYSMLKTELTGYYYTSLIGKERLVFSAIGKIGIVNSLFSSAPVPFKELYMFGGGESLRGFRWGEAGPTDRKSGAPIGATKEILCRMELITPMSFGTEFDENTPRLYVFYDVGAAWSPPVFTSIDQASNEVKPIYKKSDLIKSDFGLRQAVGIGFRTLNPQPIKVEWGYKLDRQHGSKERFGEWHIQMNIPFEA